MTSGYAETDRQTKKSKTPGLNRSNSLFNCTKANQNQKREEIKG